MAAALARSALTLARLAGPRILKTIGLAALSGGVGVGIDKIFGKGRVSGRGVRGRGRSRIFKSPGLSPPFRGGGRRRRRHHRHRRRRRRRR